MEISILESLQYLDLKKLKTFLSYVILSISISIMNNSQKCGSNYHDQYLSNIFFAGCKKVLSVLLTACNDSLQWLYPFSFRIRDSSFKGQSNPSMFEHALTQQYGHSIAAITMWTVRTFVLRKVIVHCVERLFIWKRLLQTFVIYFSFDETMNKQCTKYQPIISKHKKSRIKAFICLN